MKNPFSWLRSLFAKRPIDDTPKPITFICLECGEEFMAEYKGRGVGFMTVFYEPRECPKCGSLKTKPFCADERWYKPHGVKID